MKRIDPWLAGTVVLALVVRFVNLGSQSMWFDEATTRADVAGGLGGLWGRVRRVEGTPPLYFYVAALWTHLFGQSDFAYRTVSALAGVGTVVVVYFLVRELGCSRVAARIAAVFVAVNPFLVWYSQEARAYALFAFLGALSMLACVRAVNRPTTGWLLAYGFAAAALLATHYFAVFLIGPELVFLVVRLWRRWREFAIAVRPSPWWPIALVAGARHATLARLPELDRRLPVALPPRGNDAALHRRPEFAVPRAVPLRRSRGGRRARAAGRPRVTSRADRGRADVRERARSSSPSPRSRAQSVVTTTSIAT